MAWTPKSGRAVTWTPKSGTPVGSISLEPGGDVPSELPGIHGASGPSLQDEGSPSTKGQPTDDALGSALAGAAQGGSLGFADEIAGGGNAAQEALSRIPGLSGLAKRTPMQQSLDEEVGKVPLNLGDAYRSERDSQRAMDADAQKANPLSYLAGNVAGAAAVPIPGAGAASKLSGLAKAGVNVGRAAALGGLGGLGASTADLTQGDVGGAAKDAGLGAGVGGALGAAGEGLGALADKFGAKAAAAVQSARDKAAALARKGVASAEGVKGGVTAAARRGGEVLMEMLGSPNATEEQIAAAQKLLSSPEHADLARAVYDNALEKYPKHMGALKAAQAGLEQAQSAASPEAIESATAAATSPGKAASKLAGFATKYGMRALPAVLMGAAGGGAGLSHGGGIAGAIGGAGGMIAGAVMGAAMGHPGTAMKNAISDPAVRNVVFSVLKFGADAPAVLTRATGLPAAVAEQLVDAAKNSPDAPLGGKP
jgi:hypothetical protein